MFTILILVSLGIHRLWNWEDVFAFARAYVQHIKPLSCPPCNAFWIAVGVAGVAYGCGSVSGFEACCLPFAAYPVLRVAAAFYQTQWFAPPAQAVSTEATVSQPVSRGAECPTCALRDRIKPPPKGTRRRIVVIAARGFQRVEDIVARLADHDTVDIHVWVPLSDTPANIAYPHVTIDVRLPAVQQASVRESHASAITALRHTLTQYLSDTSVSTFCVITDGVFGTLDPHLTAHGAILDVMRDLTHMPFVHIVGNGDDVMPTEQTKACSGFIVTDADDRTRLLSRIPLQPHRVFTRAVNVRRLLAAVGHPL